MERVEQGLSYGQIADELVISRSTVAGQVNRARTAGQLTGGRRAVTLFDAADVAALVEGGHSLDAIRKRLHVSMPKLRQVLADNEIEYTRRNVIRVAPTVGLVRRAPGRPSVVIARAPVVMAPVDAAPDPATAVLFMEAGRGECRYPLWTDETPFADRKFCGGRCLETYCAFHSRLVYRER